MGGKPFPDVDPARRQLMSKIGRENTKPEILVRRALHRIGLRFRLHRHDLPGSPDVVLSSRRVAIFVHGCFWHRHDCKAGRMPKTRIDYWEAKFVRNVERDARVKAMLEAAGWTVFVIWECQAKRPETLEALTREVAMLPVIHQKGTLRAPIGVRTNPC